MLRREFAARPGRLKHAARTGLACTLTMVILIALRVPVAALGGWFCMSLLEAKAGCTWKNMVTRILVLLFIMVISPPLVGFMINAPWTMLPIVFAIVVAVNVWAPLAENPVLWVGSMAVVTSVLVTGMADSTLITDSAVGASVSVMVAVVVSTVLSRSLWVTDPDKVLAAQLARLFAVSRHRFATGVDRYLDEEDPDAPVPELESAYVALAPNVQALRSARSREKSGHAHGYRGTMVSIAQRVFALSGDFMLGATVSLRPEMREPFATELRNFQRDLDAALIRYQKQVEKGFGDAATAPRAEEDWPDLASSLAVIEREWHRLRLGLFEQKLDMRNLRIGVGAGLNVMRDLTFELRLPPDVALRQYQHRSVFSAERTPPPPSLQYGRTGAAIKGASATVLALIIAFVAGVPEAVTLAWTTLWLIQSSYGAVLRKSLLRIVGSLIGGAAAALVMIVIGGNANALLGLVFVTWLVVTWADYGAQSSPQIAYALKQVGITYLICVVSFVPPSDINSVLYRVFGILGGTLCTFVCFQFLARDYAGNQLLRTLLDMLRPLPGLASCPLGEEEETQRLVFKAERTRVVLVPEAISLVEQSLFERERSGIRNRDAMELSTLVRWANVTVCAVATARSRAPLEAFSPAYQGVLTELATATSQWLQSIIDILATTEGLGQPNTRARRQGALEILRAGSAPLPSLPRLVKRLERIHLEVEPLIKASGPEVTRPLAQEVVHLTHLASQLPKLHAVALATCLPRARSAALPVAQSA